MNPSRLKLFYTKLTHWEYWPFEVVYAPVFFYYVWLSLKARSFFFFTASNPSIETGGMMGESKYSILKNIPEEFRAFTLFFKKDTPTASVISDIQSHNLSYPIIVKPDIGERGTQVEKINSEIELTTYLAKHRNKDFLIQEYVDYKVELGVFYYRLPNEPKGVVTSIVMKDFLSVKGDGVSTIGKLMSLNPRAGFQFFRLSNKIDYDLVPKNNETIILEPIGNHCRGTMFLNGNHYINESLTEVFDSISKQIPGFFFGRYDLRCASIDELKQGKKIKIVELNGAGSEPGHIYQPGYSLFKAWKELFFHWDILYQISTINHNKGIPYMSFSEARNRYNELKRLKKST